MGNEDIVERRRGATYVTSVKSGSKIVIFKGRAIAVHPDHPPRILPSVIRDWLNSRVQD